MRLLTPPHPAVAEARRVVADPGFCASHPGIASFAWLILSTARGRPARQTRRPANPAPFFPGGDAA